MKVFEGPAEALEGLLFDGMTVIADGFGSSSGPGNLVAALLDSAVRDLTLVLSGVAEQLELNPLLRNGQVRKVVTSSARDAVALQDLLRRTSTQLEVTSPSLLAERCMAGRAGVPIFHTRTGLGTPFAEGKVLDELDGVLHVRETWLKADLGIGRAWRGDEDGNLMFRGGALRPFDSVMATAAKLTAVEVEEIVPPGTIAPNAVHNRGLYVDRIICCARAEGRSGKPLCASYEAA